MDNILPDPEYQPMLWCPGKLGKICGRQMGPVRVYLATGTHSKAENRGKLAQTCTVSHPRFITSTYSRLQKGWHYQIRK